MSRSKADLSKLQQRNTYAVSIQQVAHVLLPAEGVCSSAVSQAQRVLSLNLKGGLAVPHSLFAEAKHAFAVQHSRARSVQERRGRGCASSAAALAAVARRRHGPSWRRFRGRNVAALRPHCFLRSLVSLRLSPPKPSRCTYLLYVYSV
eukprot:6194414-Pleurochrysis_carterae.AAC.1